MTWARTEQVGAAAILRCLEEAPQDVASIASDLGCHPNTVRRHLAHLLRDGLIVEQLVHTGRPGRPARLYGAAPTPTEPLRRLALELGRRAGWEQGSRRDSAAAAVSAVTATHVRQPTIEGDDVVITECPLSAGPTAALCALHLGLAEGAALAHGATVELERTGGVCRLHLTHRS